MTHQNDAFNSGLQALTKLVLTTDYTSKPGQVADAYARSIEQGYVPYVADRSLGRMRINPGFKPTREPDECDMSERTSS